MIGPCGADLQGVESCCCCAKEGVATVSATAWAGVRRDPRAGLPTRLEGCAMSATGSFWSAGDVSISVFTTGPVSLGLRLASPRLLERRLGATVAVAGCGLLLVETWSGALMTSVADAADPRVETARGGRLGAAVGCRSGSGSTLAAGNLQCIKTS